MEATMTLLIRRISKFQPEEASKNLQWWEDQLPQSLPSAIENKLSQKESSFPSSRCELLVSGRVVLLLDFYIDFHVPYKIREEHCENVLKALPIEKLN